MTEPRSSFSSPETIKDRLELVVPFKRPKSEGPIADTSAKVVDTSPMTELSREELTARLENHDLKVDARLKDFEHRVASGIEKVDQSLQLLDKDMQAFRGIKGTIVLNSIISVIAIVGIVVGVMAYGVSSFDSGRDTAALVQDLRQQANESRQLLEQLKVQQQLQNQSK